MIGYGKYHILEGIYPHIGLRIGLLVDGNIHNIKLIYRYISNNDDPVKTLLTFVGYIMEIALTLRVILHITFKHLIVGVSFNLHILMK